MKTQVSLLAAVMTVVYGGGQCVCAAGGASGKCAAGPDAVANPVSGFVKAGVARYGKNMVTAAELMPAENTVSSLRPK